MLDSSVKGHQGCTETPTLPLRFGPLQCGEAQRSPWRGRSVCLPGWPEQPRSAWWSEGTEPKVQPALPCPLQGGPHRLGAPAGNTILPWKLGSLLTVVFLSHLGFISERATPRASAFPQNWKLISFPPLGLRRLSTPFPRKETGK